MLSVVCWKWPAPKNYRSQFGPETVNVLRRMVQRHYPHPHKFFCVTDDKAGIDPEVTVIPAWNDFVNVPNPNGSTNPSCYRRLRAFDPSVRAVFGERLVSLDLDTVITGDLSPLWNRPEDFVIWGDTNRMTPYNGSMFLLKTGTRERVWSTFDPRTSPMQQRAKRYFGSDQGWIAVALGPGEARWTKQDGVYSFRNELGSGTLPLPDNARIVFWHGRHDPWTPFGQKFEWVRKHYR